MTDITCKIGNKGPARRRGFLKTLAVSAAISVTMLASSVQAATTWKIQSVWDAGTVGYDLFKEWV